MNRTNETTAFIVLCEAAIKIAHQASFEANGKAPAFANEHLHLAIASLENAVRHAKGQVKK